MEKKIVGPVPTGHGIDPWAANLRARFHEVARRRLPSDLVEDAVQEAMRIILEKGIEPGAGADVEGLPAVAWCFQVLRHTIGNAYRRQRSRGARDASPDDPAALELASEGPTPLEALQSNEAARSIRRALERLASTDAGCARTLARMLDGASPAELAGREGTDPAILYRRIYRCRQKLRALLLAEGVEA
jgi:RNA polymerase sigma factor (sigma-70 family)